MSVKEIVLVYVCEISSCVFEFAFQLGKEYCWIEDGSGFITSTGNMNRRR